MIIVIVRNRLHFVSRGAYHNGRLLRTLLEFDP